MEKKSYGLLYIMIKLFDKTQKRQRMGPQNDTSFRSLRLKMEPAPPPHFQKKNGVYSKSGLEKSR